MKFSIVTITYNRAHIIGKTIQSVIDQTYEDHEHIIIDDASTDNTAEVVSNFNSTKLKYHRVQKSGRLSTLWNIGISLSTGDFIAILDSDDTWKPHKLETIKNFIDKNKPVSLIFHNVEIIYKNKQTRYSHFPETVNTQKIKLTYLLENDTPVYSSSVIFNKGVSLNNNNVINEYFFDGMQDFVIRMSLIPHTYYLDKSLTQIVRHNSNLTNNHTDYGFYELIDTLGFLKKTDKISIADYERYKEKNIYKLLSFYFSNGNFEKFKGLAKINLASFSLTFNKLKAILKLKFLFFIK